MKLYYAGVPGGGTTGLCVRERAKYIFHKKTLDLLLDNQRQSNYARKKK